MAPAAVGAAAGAVVGLAAAGAAGAVVGAAPAAGAAGALVGAAAGGAGVLHPTARHNMTPSVARIEVCAVRRCMR